VTERVESHDLGLHQLVSEELVVLFPRDHPLAGRGEVRMTELAQEQFISFRQGARLRELLFTASRDAQFEPRVTLESNESERIRRLVSRGLGIAILPESEATPDPNTAVVRLVAPALRRDITLAWRDGRRHSPATAAFIALSLEMFAQTPEGAPLPGTVRPAS
jgi:DNA-binding transcriptional LysR family regulator